MQRTRYAPSVRRISTESSSGTVDSNSNNDTVADLIYRLGDIPTNRILITPMLGQATEDDVTKYLDGENKRIVELIDGVLVEKPMATSEGILAGHIFRKVGNYVEDHDLGIVAPGDSPFRLRLGLVRIPDVSFISWARVPGEEFPTDAIAGLVPDLAVEVLSESNTVREIELKLDHYFQAGVRLAWIVDPSTKTADVYTSRRRSREIDIDGELLGGKVLPGFRLPMRDIFASLRRKKRKPR
jgi:Uma2 family endonuclease